VNPPEGAGGGGRWTSRRALIASGVLVVWVPGCGVATWWQVGIARSGDSLGWIYSVMWPCFAVFSVVLWWSLIHDDPETVGARGLRRMQEETVSAAAPEPEPGAPDDAIARAEEEDAELAAYNAYLAELGRGGGTKSWRRP
jgi:hypothetical protein